MGFGAHGPNRRRPCTHRDDYDVRLGGILSAASAMAT